MDSEVFIEKIVAAAIKFYLIDDCEHSFPIIMTGKRHCNIFEQMYNYNMRYDKSTHTQGFITSANRFVDRYEAKAIAVAADQLIVEEETTFAELYSEDLW